MHQAEAQRDPRHLRASLGPGVVEDGHQQDRRGDHRLDQARGQDHPAERGGEQGHAVAHRERRDHEPDVADRAPLALLHRALARGEEQREEEEQVVVAGDEMEDSLPREATEQRGQRRGRAEHRLLPAAAEHLGLLSLAEAQAHEGLVLRVAREDRVVDQTQGARGATA